MTYQLMYKDVVVAEFEPQTVNDYTVFNAQFLPVGLRNGMSLERWLHQRRADKSRVSVRKLFATLKLNFGDDDYISGFRKPTDFWWLRKKGSDELFAMEVEDLHLIALGIEAVVPKSPRNFEVANIGSYEKGWKNDNLLKSGNLNEIFSEMLYARISEKYMPTATYASERIGERVFVSTPNFINQQAGEYLVLADEWTGTGAEEEFSDWLAKYANTLADHEMTGMKIMYFLDVVMNNFDRHCQNFGFVYHEKGDRNLAPNFDFNLSIIGYNGLANLGANEMTARHYFDLFNEVPESLKTPPMLSMVKSEIKDICTDLGLDCEAYMVIADWLVTRWEQILNEQ